MLPEIVRPVAHPHAPYDDALGPSSAMQVALRLVAAVGLIGPLGWVAGWFGLPSNAPEFLMTGLGRLAWSSFGGPDAMVIYWLLLSPLAVGATYAPRLQRPLMALATFWWVWQVAYMLSTLAPLSVRVPPPLTPWS